MQSSRNHRIYRIHAYARKSMVFVNLAGCGGRRLRKESAAHLLMSVVSLFSCQPFQSACQNTQKCLPNNAWAIQFSISIPKLLYRGIMLEYSVYTPDRHAASEGPGRLIDRETERDRDRWEIRHGHDQHCLRHRPYRLYHDFTP